MQTANRSQAECRGDWVSPAALARQALEPAALAAHADGMTWAEFWPSVAGDVAAAEPYDRRRFHALVRRLTALVAAGDLDGAVPPQDGYGRPMDWELDDLATAAAGQEPKAPAPPPPKRYLVFSAPSDPDPAKNRLRIFDFAGRLGGQVVKLPIHRPPVSVLRWYRAVNVASRNQRRQPGNQPPVSLPVPRLGRCHVAGHARPELIPGVAAVVGLDRKTLKGLSGRSR